jgi:hypothetical protein
MMHDTAAVIEHICQAFGGNAFPGAGSLQGSFDGCEPYEAVYPFQTQHEWRDLDAAFLDAHADALSFFSEAGFRFFLPAYLIADVEGQLRIADPMFHLTHGFAETAVQVPTPGRVLVLRHGQSAFINPRRYGAATRYDYARYRLSVFTREEAGAIVAYLECRREADPDTVDHAAIEAALQSFWQERAQTAPVAASLQQYLAEHEAYPVAMRTASQEHQGAS